MRTKDEFKGKDRGKDGPLKNSINIPVDELKGRMAEMEKYTNKEIIVYIHIAREARE